MSRDFPKIPLFVCTQSNISFGFVSSGRLKGGALALLLLLHWSHVKITAKERCAACVCPFDLSGRIGVVAGGIGSMHPRVKK
jgi:hypothetical protein